MGGGTLPAGNPLKTSCEHLAGEGPHKHRHVCEAPPPGRRDHSLSEHWPLPRV